jgi:RimJ/RimL family protein N-acetyltransferase
MCGLLKRDSLPDVDVGYAYRPAFWSNGYAFEAASRSGPRTRGFGLRRIVAITSPDNAGSRACWRSSACTMRDAQPSPGQDTHLFAVEA